MDFFFFWQGSTKALASLCTHLKHKQCNIVHIFVFVHIKQKEYKKCVIKLRPTDDQSLY